MHHHAEPEEIEGYITNLRRFERVFEPLHQQVVAWLNIPPGSYVLDVGCGTGSVTGLLAEAVQADEHVTALDIEPELLTAAKETLSTTPYTIVYREGTLDDLPFEDSQFDLVWCSRVVHHMPDQLAAVRELHRVLKPGGRLALREDSLNLYVLPFDIGLGQPGLDERLNAIRAWEFAQLRPSLPNFIPYPFGWTHLLREAGLTDVSARSFLLEALPPFSTNMDAFVMRHWARFLEDDELKARLYPHDQQVLAQIIDPTNPHS